MATQTKNDTTLNDLFDVQGAVERLADANRKAGNDYLDLYEKTVGQLTDLEVEIADAVQLPAVSTIAKTHADVTRKVAGTYVDTARELLKA
ncbi:MAG: hypothetical protein M3O90_02310 [Actinomycetota bacterium]|nr:hypothetical protein [Actinomycetota bacterium]